MTGLGSMGGAAGFLICAVATGAAFLPGIWGWTLLFSLGGMVACLRGVGKTRAFLRGWLFGTVAWAVGLYWFPPVVAEYAAGIPGLRWVFFLIIVGYLGLQVAIGSWLIRAAADALTARGWSEAAALAAASVPAWVIVDGYFPPLFPAPIATALLFHLPLLQSLELFGCAGPAWILSLSNAGVFFSFAAVGASPRARLLPLAGVASLLLGSELYGLARMAAVDRAAATAVAGGRTLRVALLQASIPFGRRRTGQFIEENIETYRELSAAAAAAGPLDLVVWPQNTYERLLRAGEDGSFFIGDEAAEAVLLRDIPAGISALVTTMADETDGKRRYVTLLRGADGNISGASYKRHPTPLSEYFPLGGLLPFLYRFTPHMNRIAPGTQAPLRAAGASFGSYICYDGMKPDSALALAALGAELLINPSSDQWSRDRSVQPLQAFAVTRLRAVETRRYLLRVTPNGMSSVVDAAGRLVAEIPVDDKGFLRAEIPRLQERTPAGFFGSALYRLALVLWAGLVIFGYRRRTVDKFQIR